VLAASSGAGLNLSSSPGSDGSLGSSRPLVEKFKLSLDFRRARDLLWIGSGSPGDGIGGNGGFGFSGGLLGIGTPPVGSSGRRFFSVAPAAVGDSAPGNIARLGCSREQIAGLVQHQRADLDSGAS